MTNSPAETPELPFALQSDEHVVLFRRRHWVYAASRLVAIALIWLVPLVAVLWITQVTAGLDGTAGLIVLIAAAAWTLYWAIRAYFTWYRYANDVWVVTNQRLIDSTKYHWFKQRLASADLVDVEDINVVREGLFATMFNYGDVRCQTAGEMPNFVLSGIPEPSATLGIVDATRDAARRGLTRPLS